MNIKEQLQDILSEKNQSKLKPKLALLAAELEDESVEVTLDVFDGLDAMTLKSALMGLLVMMATAAM